MKTIARGSAARTRSGQAFAAGSAAVVLGHFATGAEHDTGIEVDLSAHEPAWYVRVLAGCDDDVEPLARRVRES